jgi:hypothetical protein
VSYEFGVGEYTMRNGRRAVVLSDKYHDGKYVLMGVCETDSGGWELMSWTRTGQFQGIYESAMDLMPPVVHTWRNLYSNGETSPAYQSRKLADFQSSSHGRVAVLHFTHTADGEFVGVELEEV